MADLGFLTPTPLAINETTVRVYGGMRARTGISTIGWVELDSRSQAITRVCDGPAIELGKIGQFDDHGMILGDVVSDPQSGEVTLIYVGFQMVPGVKFRAFTGAAYSNDGGEAFVRKSPGPILSDIQTLRPTDIAAIHWARQTSDGWAALAAIGDGWEFIDGAPFPRYNVFGASGPSLCSLMIDQKELLEMPDDTYRLGRPRVFVDTLDAPTIVATGGKRNGDYRAYAFKLREGAYAPVPLEFPVFPGCSPSAQVQAAYPAQALTACEEWVFFNGDAMGREGAMLITRPRRSSGVAVS